MVTRVASLAVIRRPAVRAAALLLGIACAAGLVLLRPAAGAGETPLRLQGRILRPDGRPAARVQAVIDVWRERLVTVTTDARGRYSVALESRAPQWIEARVPRVGLSRLLPVTPGKQATITLDIRLAALPIVSGVIFLPNGRPAAGATFEVRGAVWRDLESMMDLGDEPRPAGIPGSQGKSGGTLLTVVTDATGHYQVPLFPDEAPEHLSVFGSGTNYEIRLLSPDGRGWSEVIRFTTNLDHPAVHQDISLRAGEQVDGVVTGHPGAKALPGAYVYAVVPGLGPAPLNRPEVVAGAVADDQGRFRIATALQPGGYALGAYAGNPWGFAGVAEAGPEGVVELGRRRVELQLVREGRLHGRLLHPDGTPVAKATQPVTVRAVSEGEPWEYTADIETDEEGRYELAFKTLWEARMPWGRGVRQAVISARGQETVLPPKVVDFMEASDQEVDLGLSETGSAFGRVVYPDDKPATGVSVFVAPAAEQAKLWGTGDLHAFYDHDASVRIVREDGAFDLRGVPPGDYFLVVLACTIYETSAQEGTAIPVTIVPGRAAGPFTVMVRPRPVMRGRLSGLPTAPDDQASLALDCIMRPTGSEVRARRVRLQVEEDGHYTAWASGYGSGSYDVMFLATHEGKAYVSPVKHGVELQGSAVREGLDFALSPGGSISGRLALASDKPAAGTEVVLRPASGDALMLFPLLICGQDDMGERAFRAETDRKGQFSFTGLLPGRYELSVVWRPGRGAEEQTAALSLDLGESERRAGLVIKLPQAAL
jgi:hypothetical protein